MRLQIKWRLEMIQWTSRSLDWRWSAGDNVLNTMSQSHSHRWKMMMSKYTFIQDWHHAYIAFTTLLSSSEQCGEINPELLMVLMKFRQAMIKIWVIDFTNFFTTVLAQCSLNWVHLWNGQIEEWSTVLYQTVLSHCTLVLPALSTALYTVINCFICKGRDLFQL